MADGYLTRGKEPPASTQADEAQMKNLQRDELYGMKFYLDKNWMVVHLPEATPSPSSSRNYQAEQQQTLSPISMAAQHQLQPPLGQKQDQPHYVGNLSVTPEQPGQSAMHFLYNQPPPQPTEVHAPAMLQDIVLPSSTSEEAHSGSCDDMTFRPMDLAWKYAHRVPHGKSYRVQCNLCGKVVSNISRMKEHLAGIGKESRPCPNTTDEIRQEIMTYIIAKKNSRAGASSSAHGDAT